MKNLDGAKCIKCGCQVQEENVLDYPFYCPECDENLYSFEVETEE